MTGSSCVPAGFSYLTAFGLGVFALVLSSWVVQIQRAVYRDGPALQRGFANATPPWVPGLTGAVLIFLLSGWLAGWVQNCVPARDWNVFGVVLLAVAGVLALIATGRLVRGRIRLGSREPGAEHVAGGTAASEASTGAAERPRFLSPERRRVIVEFALTYEAAVILALIGIGLA